MGWYLSVLVGGGHLRYGVMGFVALDPSPRENGV